MKKLFIRWFKVPAEMVEMAEIFHMPAVERWKYIYLPAIFGRKAAKE